MYCAIAEDYLADMAQEDKGIADLLDMFRYGSPEGVIQKAAPIRSIALHQMWLVEQGIPGIAS